jgi:hypothetical protein
MKVQNAHQKLMHIKMKGDALDEYIAEFQTLRAKASWGSNDTGTIMLFKQGLMPGLHCAVLEKTSIQLTSLAGWANATQEQHALWAKVKASIHGNAPKLTIVEGQKWRPILGRPCDERGWWDKGQWCGVWKEDQMARDSAKVNALSVEERNKLQKDRKCFNCKKVGHQSRNCPNKENAPKSHNNQHRNQGMTMQVAEAEEKGEKKKKELTESIKTMSMEERNDLLDDLVLAGF